MGVQNLELITLTIGLILIIILIFKRIKEKQTEKFEDRDN